jgi:hypothetical protein
MTVGNQDGSAGGLPEPSALEKIQAENESRYVSESRHYPGQAQLEGHFPASVLRRIADALEAAQRRAEGATNSQNPRKD